MHDAIDTSDLIVLDLHQTTVRIGYAARICESKVILQELTTSRSTARGVYVVSPRTVKEDEHRDKRFRKLNCDILVLSSLNFYSEF
jgi:hypothetical protein